MLKYGYQCADFVNLDLNQGVIRAKSFQNTFCSWPESLNLQVVENMIFGEKYEISDPSVLVSSLWLFINVCILTYIALSKRRLEIKETSCNQKKLFKMSWACLFTLSKLEWSALLVCFCFCFCFRFCFCFCFCLFCFVFCFVFSPYCFFF